MKTRKRLIALFLALALCIGALPCAALFPAMAYSHGQVVEDDSIMAGEVISEPEDVQSPTPAGQENEGNASAGGQTGSTPTAALPAVPTANILPTEQTVDGQEGTEVTWISGETPYEKLGIMPFASSLQKTGTLYTLYVSSFPNGSPGHTTTWGSLTSSRSHMMTIDGVYNAAYCLDQELGSIAGAEHTTNGTNMDDISMEKQKIIGFILANGFQWNSNAYWSQTDNDKWLVTQLLIWATMRGHFTFGNDHLIHPSASVRPDIVSLSTKAYNASSFVAYYDSLVKKLKDARLIPSFCTYIEEKIGTKTLPAQKPNPIILKSNGTSYSAKVTDKNKVLKHFNFYNQVPGVTTSQNEYNMTLSTSAEITGTLSNGDKSVSYAPKGGENAVLAYRYAPDPKNYQRFACWTIATDPVYPKLTVATDGTPHEGTKIIKISEDGIPAGREFGVSGSDGSYYQRITNSNGEIDLSDLPVYEQIPVLDEDGNPVIDEETGEAMTTQGPLIVYTVQEINVPDRYVNPPSITFTMETDRILEFDNRLKKWRVTVSKSDAETGTAQGDATLSGAVYGIYQNGVLQDTYSTDANGRFTTDYYPCGSGYTLEEISPSTGYLLNTASTALGAGPGLFTAEYNSIASNVTEQVIKGKICLTKHTDKGETGIETPEAGAEFEVFLTSAGSYAKAKESERDALVIDAAGHAQSKDLPYGTYTVHQTKGWEGKEKVDDFQVQVSENGKAYSFILNNRAFESLVTVIKRDIETGRTIPASGISFKIKNADTGEFVVQHINYPTPQDISIFQTDVTGKLMLPEKLDYGSYELIEVATAYGYVLDSTPVPFKVDGTAKEVVVEKSNVPQKGKISVLKQGEVFSSVVQENGVYTPVYSEQGLSGAVFEITAAQDIITPEGTVRFAMDEVVDTITTDSTGAAASRPLYLGKYWVKEKKAPEGYVLNPLPHLVTLSYSGQTVDLTAAFLNVKDARQKASITVHKALEKAESFQIGVSEEYQNVTFGLFAAENITASDGSTLPADGLLETVGITENGLGTFTKDIPFGSYYVKELTTDDHYLLSDEKWPLEFVYGNPLSPVVFLHTNGAKNIENTLKRGQIDGKKLSEDGSVLPGALMGLFHPGETEFTEEKAVLLETSDEAGRFTFSDVPYGPWVVHEVSSPEGYVLSGESFPVMVAKDDQHIEVTVNNAYIRGDVRLTKIDKDFTGQKLSGAAFDVYRDNDGNGGLDERDEKIGALAETAKGIYTMKGLRYGGYFVVETKAPDNYEIDTAPRFFEIQKDGAVVELEVANAPQLGSLLIKKASEDGVVEGIRFIVSGKPYSGGTYEETFETDENGEIHVEGLRLGEYTVSEVMDESTVRYAVEADKTVTVTYNSTAEVSFYNKLRRGSVSIIKTDAKDHTARLTGAEFKLYADSDYNKRFDVGKDKFYSKLEADNGVYWLEGLPSGGFFLQESIAPEGYARDSKMYYFEVDEDTTQIEITNTNDATVGFVNSRLLGKLTIIKTSTNGNVLTGANFCVENEDGEVVAEGTTGKDGKVVFKDLPTGSYYYREICAPQGYETDGTRHPFQIAEEHLEVEVTVKNHEIPFYVPQTGDGRINPAFFVLLIALGASVLIVLTFHSINHGKKNKE